MSAALWKPGQSGNPKGRPKGSVNRRTQIADAFIEDGKNIARIVCDAALAGDMQAAQIVLSRILPVLRPTSERVKFDLDTTAPLTEQARQVLSAVAGGEVDPDTGKRLIDSISAFAGLRQVDEFEARLNALEGNQT